MNHGNAALDLTDDLEYLFADEAPEHSFLEGHWAELARRHRQRAQSSDHQALDFDDELQRELDQQLDADEDLVNLEDDDLLDLSLVIDDDDLPEFDALPDRPLY